MAAIETRSARISEYELKAAFLFNFARFIEWPADAFEDSRTPITIGVLGQNPFGSSLDQIVANETAHGRALAIRHCRTVDEAAGCHILFISPSEAGRLDRILAALGNRSVLTVGESRDFTARRGMISFHLVRQRLRLRINRTAATAARLTINSQLLRQAELVKGTAK